jgi:hypothetical protein
MPRILQPRIVAKSLVCSFRHIPECPLSRNLLPTVSEARQNEVSLCRPAFSRVVEAPCISEVMVYSSLHDRLGDESNANALSHLFDLNKLGMHAYIGSIYGNSSSASVHLVFSVFNANFMIYVTHLQQAFSVYSLCINITRYSPAWGTFR